MYEDRDLMQELNGLPCGEEPLTATELDQLTRTVLNRVQRAEKRKTHRKARHRCTVWSKVVTSAAACVVLLAGLNGFQPALAEGLPILGDVFAYINGRSKAHLQSDQLADYAQPVQLEAESAPAAAPEGDLKAVAPQQDTAAEQPYTLTLSQVYCDELYLRVGLVLTTSDDSLAGFEGVTIDPPLLYEDTSEEEANTLYGGVTLNGESVSGDLVPYFRKQDDHTFVCEMDYSLANYTGDTQSMQASITFSHLVGVSTGDGAVGAEEKTPLEGTYALHFTVSADASLTRMGTFAEETQNGITLKSVAATPGETCVSYVVSSSVDGNVSPALQVFTADGTRLQPANGTITEDGEDTMTKEYLDAVPEGVISLTVRVVDKNSEELTTLAQWTVTLPQ